MGALLSGLFDVLPEPFLAVFEFNELELLFDLQMSNYRTLKDCNDDLILLKNLWDAIVLSRETFDSWNDIL